MTTATPDARRADVVASADTAIPVRLTLVDRVRADRPVLDGAWWPRSPSLVTELPALIVELEIRGVSISRVAYQRESWEPAPRRLPVAGRTVRLGWFPGLDPHLVRLSGEGGRVRLDLLVVPPRADDAVATRAMAAASGRRDQAGATAVLADAAALPEPVARAHTCPACGSMPLTGGHCECGYADFDAANHLRLPRA